MPMRAGAPYSGGLWLSLVRRSARPVICLSAMAHAPPARFTSFRAFYPFYLAEHRNRTCRRLHFVGSTLALLFIGLALARMNPWWLTGALVSGYGFAWIGHFFFEKNRPATFTYPLYSFLGDWVMYAQIWRGRIPF
jgi:hypothetical protein